MTLARLPSLPLLATVALVAFAGVGRADGPPMNPPAAPAPAEAPRNSRFFDTYDANQDGKVTKDEYTGDPSVFDVVDSDKDGVVTLAELGMPADYKPTPLPKPMDQKPDAGRGGSLAERLEKFRLQLAGWDADKDGKVTKDEYKGKLPFDTIDRNKDGVISMEDLRGAGKGEPGPAGAMPNAEEMRQRLKDADKNGDGKITKDEFPGPPERFEALDRNRDGGVTGDEVEAALRDGMNGEGGRGKRMFQRFDKDGDGKVSRAEFPGGDEAFKAMDKDGDGFVTAEEVPTNRPGKGEKPPEPTGAPAPTTPSDPMAPAAPAPSGGLGTLFAALDRDHDGKLCRAEFPGTDDEWRRLDRNANGWVEADEAK
jgi:Ca2+-binding EF-hand superfamily protein